MRTKIAFAGVATAAVTALLLVGPGPADAGTSGTSHGAGACSPSVDAVGYSDALDKLQVGSAEVSGLSSLAWDARQHAWVSALDNNGTTPAYVWTLRDLAHPSVVHNPLVLKRSDGTAYDGTTVDDEGLAVLPDSDYLVSSETEPSIRVYGRDGVQKQSLPVPARFAVTGTTTAGEATSNATLEGLTITPDGRTIIASMEDALSGDVSASGDASAHRILIYTRGAHGYRLAKQVEYRTEAGMRIPEVAAYDGDSIVVEEAAWTANAGNAVNLYAVTGLSKAPDVSRVPDLGDAPQALSVHKTRLADLVDCPDLGAPALETQANPLLDNFEGMAVTGRQGAHAYGLSLVSDDNNSPQQHTRILNLRVRLP